MIWTKDELKVIKRTVLLKTTLTIDENGEICNTNKTNGIAYNESLFNLMLDEIIYLLSIKDKALIADLYEKATSITFEPKNQLHFGLIKTLSEVNCDDYTKVFEIFKNLCTIYEHAIISQTNKITNNMSVEDIDYIANRIKNNPELNIEEIEIMENINKTLVYANCVLDHELIKPIITKLNSILRKRLVAKLKHTIRKIEIQEKKEEAIIYNEYKLVQSNSSLTKVRSSKAPIIYYDNTRRR